MHCTPSAEHGVPSFGTTAGQPAVVGGSAHCHSMGGAMHGPSPQALHTQIASPKVQTWFTLASMEHTLPEAGCVVPQPVDIEQALCGLVHVPFMQVQASRQSGRVDVP